MIRHRRRARGPKLDVGPKLKLTSMMDILTTLLLFLLKAFVVDGEAMTPPPGVDLPVSTAEDVVESSVVVAISANDILVAGQPAASVPDALASRDLVIPGLDAQLLDARARMEHLAELKGVAAPEPKVTIQGDRAIEFQLLEKVMYTCGEAGFEQLSLAVLQEG